MCDLMLVSTMEEANKGAEISENWVGYAIS